MDSTRITDFPTLQSYEARDKLLLQRLEAGVWNDYYTEAADYLGQYFTKVIDWDMSVALGETISPATPGNYLVLLDALGIYTPGASYTDNPFQIFIIPAPSASWDYIGEFTHASTGRACAISPVSSPPTYYGDVAEDLYILSPFTASHGSCRIIIRYVEVTPL
jgi:hypothetical protein